MELQTELNILNEIIISLNDTEDKSPADRMALYMAYKERTKVQDKIDGLRYIKRNFGTAAEDIPATCGGCPKGIWSSGRDIHCPEIGHLVGKDDAAQPKQCEANGVFGEQSKIPEICGDCPKSIDSDGHGVYCLILKTRVTGGNANQPKKCAAEGVFDEPATKTQSHEKKNLATEITEDTEEKLFIMPEKCGACELLNVEMPFSMNASDIRDKAFVNEVIERKLRYCSLQKSWVDPENYLNRHGCHDTCETEEGKLWLAEALKTKSLLPKYKKCNGCARLTIAECKDLENCEMPLLVIHDVKPNPESAPAEKELTLQKNAACGPTEIPLPDVLISENPEHWKSKLVQIWLYLDAVHEDNIQDMIKNIRFAIEDSPELLKKSGCKGIKLFGLTEEKSDSVDSVAEKEPLIPQGIGPITSVRMSGIPGFLGLLRWEIDRNVKYQPYKLTLNKEHVHLSKEKVLNMIEYMQNLLETEIIFNE